jgi:ABC-2 type transport system permease protein
VIRAFWFVTTRSFKNRILQRLRKLRSPRYALSMLAGLAYLWFIAFRRMTMSTGHANFGALPVTDLGVDIVSVIVFAIMLLAWATPDSGGGLTFSEAEIQFLFPAPVTRRELLIYKIFRQQPPILISAFMMTWFGFRHSKFVGLWIAFMVLSIYFTMVSLARARLKLAHFGFLARLTTTVVIAVAAATLIASDIHNPFVHAQEPRSAAEFGALLRGAGSLFHNPLVRTLLFIPRFFATAVFPKSVATLALACAAMIAIGFAFFQIAARLNVSFEEASVTASQKRQGLRASIQDRRAGRAVVFRSARSPFHLTERSGPELAIVWKNLTAALRTSVAWMVMIVVIFSAFAVDAVIMRGSNMHMGVAAISLMLCGLFPFLGSNLLRQDLRLDLPRIELLKSYPIPGDRLVLAEIAAPTLIVAVVEVFLLSGTAILTHLSGDASELARWMSPEFIVIALLFAIPICAMQLLIRNAVVILLPSWATQPPDESRGFNVFGQRLVILGGNVIVLVVGLLPAAIVFLPTFFLAHKYFGSSPLFLALGTVPSIAVLCVEIWIAIHLLGAQFDQIDVAGEIGTPT